jgi:hypothetical protein
MDGRKAIKVKVTRHREKWSAVRYEAGFAFMGLNEHGRLVKATEAAVYMIMN